MTDFEADLRRIREDLQDSAPGSGQHCAPHSQAWVLYQRLRLLSLTGDLPGLRTLASEIDAAIALGTCNPDLYLCKCHVALKRHRFAEAEQALHTDPSLLSFPLGRLFLSDIYLQYGRYAEAEQLIDAAMEHDPTWDAMARAAYLAFLRGNIDRADTLYAAAEDELTAKQMQTFAWLELQRGWMHLQQGNSSRAGMHYRKADMAYSGYWLTAERLAELAGVDGSFEEALNAYRHLCASSPRPEWEHAMGDLYVASGDVKSALAWKHKAYCGYTESLQRGETYYLHCIADLCCEMPDKQAEGVTYARSDLALRNNFTTQSNLAWALYRSVQTDEAAQWIECALASGMVSSRLYLQAACVYASTRNVEQSRKYMGLSQQANPNPARAKLRNTLPLSITVSGA